MGYWQEIENFTPENEQEKTDKAVMLHFMEANPASILLRENRIAHITSSGFIVNPAGTRVLLAHHNIRGVWAWSGGHADGDENLLRVAQKEAKEETGLAAVRPLFSQIASLDILPVEAHVRKGEYVNAHLHLSVAYLLVADDALPLRPCPGENTAVQWFAAEHFTTAHFSERDTYLYGKLLRRAQAFFTSNPS